MVIAVAQDVMVDCTVLVEVMVEIDVLVTGLGVTEDVLVVVVVRVVVQKGTSLQTADSI